MTVAVTIDLLATVTINGVELNTARLSLLTGSLLASARLGLGGNPLKFPVICSPSAVAADPKPGQAAFPQLELHVPEI